MNYDIARKICFALAEIAKINKINIQVIETYQHMINGKPVDGKFTVIGNGFDIRNQTVDYVVKKLIERLEKQGLNLKWHLEKIGGEFNGC